MVGLDVPLLLSMVGLVVVMLGADIGSGEVIVGEMSVVCSETLLVNVGFADSGGEEAAAPFSRCCSITSLGLSDNYPNLDQGEIIQESRPFSTKAPPLKKFFILCEEKKHVENPSPVV